MVAPQIIPSLIASSLGLLLAMLVLFTRPDRLQNRLLALVIALEAFGIGGGTAWMYLAEDARAAHGFQAITIVAVLAQGPVYLMFLATLDSPVVAWARRRSVRAFLWTLTFVAPVIAIWHMDAIVLGMTPGRFAPWDSVLSGWFFVIISQLIIWSILGLIVAIDAYRRAPPGARKREARGYLQAFAVRDAGHVLGILAFVSLGDTGGFAGVTLPGLTVSAYLPLLAYAILRNQMFGIDHKVLVGASGTLAAAVLALSFIVGTELIESQFDDRWSIAIAIALALAFRPLQVALQYRLRRRFPSAKPMAEMADDERERVYREQVELAWADGELGAKERTMLDRMAQQLGLDARAQRRAERAAGHAPPSGTITRAKTASLA